MLVGLGLGFQEHRDHLSPHSKHFYILNHFPTHSFCGYRISHWYGIHFSGLSYLVREPQRRTYLSLASPVLGFQAHVTVPVLFFCDTLISNSASKARTLLTELFLLYHILNDNIHGKEITILGPKIHVVSLTFKFMLSMEGVGAKSERHNSTLKIFDKSNS